jgi:hypothetical protein
MVPGEVSMKRKSAVILPIATALASLNSGAGATATTNGASDRDAGTVKSQAEAIKAIPPNTVYNAGEDLFGLLVSRNADGTVVAQHSSHASHASHASHSSGH